MELKKIDGIAFAAGRWPLSPDLPTLVFIHGSGGTGGMWRDQVRALSFLVNTLAIDLPGHGRSDGDGMDFVKGYAEVVSGFVGKLELPKPVACGLSLGGAIVQQLLLDYADPLQAGILVSTGARLKVMPELLETVESDYGQFVSLYEKIGFSGKTDRERLKSVLAETSACRPAVTAGDFRACDRFDVMDRLREIDLPVLVISASDDRLTPPHYSDYLQKHIRRSARTRVKDAGHMVPVEKPAAVTSAIVDFLDSVAAGF
ncbi:MAG: alpha/beta fold hydrolase [Desulfobacterales bacterium]